MTLHSKPKRPIRPAGLCERCGVRPATTALPLTDLTPVGLARRASRLLQVCAQCLAELTRGHDTN